MKRVMILLMAGAVVSGVAAYMAAARTVPGTLGREMGREPAQIAAAPENMVPENTGPETVVRANVVGRTAAGLR